MACSDYKDCKNECEEAYDTYAGDFKCAEVLYVGISGVGIGTCIAYPKAESVEGANPWATDWAAGLGAVELGFTAAAAAFTASYMM